MKQADAIHTAKQFIQENFPSCDAAILAGSVVRGEATATSDLDIVIFDSQLAHSFRESLRVNGWPIECFAHNLESYQSFFKEDRDRGRPSLQKMVAEGIPLQDNGILTQLKKEAEQQLAAGPEPWDERTIVTKRYFLTDLLDDFIGSSKRAEDLFIAGELAQVLHEFLLRTNNCWIGSSKWIYRALEAFDPIVAVDFVRAFDRFYLGGEKQPVIDLAEQILAPYGGRLFEGFSVGKNQA